MSSMVTYTIRGRETIAVLLGAYTHPIHRSGVTYCGILITSISKTAVAEEFDCPACRARMEEE